MSCTKCALHLNARTVCVPDRVPGPEVKLLVVGDTPGYEEDLSGVAFSGKAGKLLHSIFSSLEVDQNLVAYSSVTKCNSGASPPKKEHAKACADYLYTMLAELKSSQGYYPTVLSLGASALEFLTGKKSITKVRGVQADLVLLPGYKARFEELEKGVTVVPTVNPLAYLRGGNDEMLTHLVEDTIQAWKHATGDNSSYADTYEWVDTVEGAIEVLSRIPKEVGGDGAPFFALDLETTGLDMFDPESKIVALCLSWGKGMGYIIPFHHIDCPWRDDPYTHSMLASRLKKVLEVDKVPVVGWNFKFDLKWLHSKWGISDVNLVWDGMLSHFWIWGERKPHDLNTIAAEELGFVGHGGDMYRELATLDKAQRHMGNSRKAILLKYGAGDAEATYRLSLTMRETIRDLGSEDAFMRLMVNGVKPMARMEENGIKVDLAATAYLREYYPGKMAVHEDVVLRTPWGQKTLEVLAARKPKPGKFSLGSAPTLRELVLEQMKMPATKFSKKTGKASLDKDTLVNLLEAIEGQGFPEEERVLRALCDWRKDAKYYTSYVKKMPEITRGDGYFHTTYNLSGTVTGRHSTSSPSIHTIPKESDVKLQFQSRWRGDGGVILSVDMSQAEVRVAATLSKDQGLIDTLLSGVDMHTANASKIFKVPLEEVTKPQRSLAKTITFATLYGSSAARIAATAGIPLGEAEEAISAFFGAFPGLHKWMKVVYRDAVKKGYVETVFGRRRYVPGIETSRWGDKAWRQAINTQIQSTASDITYTALLTYLEKSKGFESKPFGFIHDSIIVDVAPKELDKVYHLLVECMESWTKETYGDWLLVPMVADGDVCPGWSFPCHVDGVTDGNWEVSGPSKSIYLLNREVEKFGQKIESIDFGDGKEGLRWFHGDR